MPLVRTDLFPDLKPAINQWVHDHGGGLAFPDSYESIGWEVGHHLVGAVVFHTCNGVQCWANIALTPKVNALGLLRCAFRYCDQLGLHRLTFLISPANISSINFVTGLGATHEATLREAGREGDLHIYALFRRDCSIWSKVRERFPFSARKS